MAGNDRLQDLPEIKLILNKRLCQRNSNLLHAKEEQKALDYNLEQSVTDIAPEQIGLSSVPGLASRPPAT